MKIRERVGVWGCRGFGVTPIGALAATCLFLLTASAAFGISNNAGTNNGAFLKIPTDARGVALGPAIVSMAEGTDGMRWNPAALASLQANEASSTHVQYYQGVFMENVAVGHPLEQSALAASVFYLSAGTLDGRDTLGNATGDFQFYDLVGGLSYGRQLFTRDEWADVSVGGTLKVVQEKIANSQFQNPAFDVGLLVSPWDDFNGGLSVRNLCSGQANFPKEVLAGGSYTLYHTFTGGVAVNYATDAPLRYSVGGEYLFTDIQTALRAGYQNHDPLDSSIDSDIRALRGASLAGLTMGAGYNYHPIGFKTLSFQLDYAMAPFGALGLAHTITVKVKW